MKIDNFLLEKQIVIRNALANTDILEALSGFGYDEARILEGRRILDEALELVSKQQIDYGEQYGATGELNKAFKAAKEAYMRSLTVARVAYKKDVKAQTALMLKGRRESTYSGWLLQVESFYDNIDSVSPDGSGLFRFGYTREKLDSERALVEQVKKALLIQKKAKGVARDATKKRNAKLGELGEWVGEFVDIAEVALADDPQLLEKLGIRK